jgi:hypothetical protein
LGANLFGNNKKENMELSNELLALEILEESGDLCTELIF